MKRFAYALAVVSVVVAFAGACGPVAVPSAPKATSAPAVKAPCYDPENDGDCHPQP